MVTMHISLFGDTQYLPTHFMNAKQAIGKRNAGE